MPVQRYFSSLAVPTALAGGISNASTNILVQAATGFPVSLPYTLALDDGGAAMELVDVTAAAGTSLTVTRGVDGTSAQSHSIGAVVRHVVSARDFSEFQSHQAAVSGVHGIAGTLVGTSDSQTLANKTLTAPTVNGGTLTGTFTGAPILTGGLTFTGSDVLVERSATTDTTYRGRVTGDTQSRYAVDASGKVTWGPGGASTRDTNLYRSAADRLTTDDTFHIGAAGTLLMGSGADTNLYRTAAGALQTDGTLSVGGVFTAVNYPSGAGSSWTPVWSTSTGLHTPTFGNTAIQSLWLKLGHALLFSFGWSFGSTTNFGASATTSDNWQFSLPGGLTADAQYQGTNAAVGFGVATAGSGATIPIQVRVDATGQNFTLDTAGGRQDGAALANTGGLDSLTPWTWASGNAIRVSGMLMTTT